MLAAMLRQSTSGGSGDKVSKSRSMHKGNQDSLASDPNYIMQTVSDVRKFADVLLKFKDVFISTEGGMLGFHDADEVKAWQCASGSLRGAPDPRPPSHQDQENQSCLHKAVHERLGEMLAVLMTIINKHQSLNSVDILSSAGTVITAVKGVNFEEVNEENKQSLFSDIYFAIDKLAFTVGYVVSDFLMGDVENGSVLGLPLTKRSGSFDNLPVESGGSGSEKDDPPVPAGVLGPPLRVEEVDRTLQQLDNGVESALRYAKAWSKYTKEVLGWVEKRLNMDIELAKSYNKMAESAKTLASQQEFMPFRDIYMAAFRNDIEYSRLVLNTTAVLQSNKFMQPLMTRKNELDKLRKEMKEQWQREQKKMHEADSALKKARMLQDQRQEEYEKAKVFTSRLEGEQTGGVGGATTAKQLEKRRRLEEEAWQKADEARAHSEACQIDVVEKRVDLAKTKSEVITQLRKMIFQCDLTLKAVTVNWFQLQQAQVVSLPVNHQSLCENSKLYEPGNRYVEFVRSLPHESHYLDSSFSSSTGMLLTQRTLSGSHSSNSNQSQGSVTSDLLGTDDIDGSNANSQQTMIMERRSKSSTDTQAHRNRSWNSASQGGGMCSDSESVGGSSESRSMDSPTASPGDFKRKLPRSPSTGTMSSADDLDEPQSPSDAINGLNDLLIEAASSPRPFRNTQMSKAAQTHKFRKLRAPSKCRQCDGLVVLQGAECEECSLACHKKCLESLAIQCGHKKLQRKLHLFGVDFTQTAKNSEDGIPFIIRKCTSEIETRALNVKGIYRLNGAKSRVEKLCQAFENGKDLVEMSDLYPHDISNVLKLYLRQLPEPLILFRYYNELIGLAKESQSGIVEDLEAFRLSSSPVTPSQVGVELNRILFKLKDLLRQLPPANYKTLQFIIEHLHRVTEQSEENKMPARNLGIIFGPTLIKPRQSDAEVSSLSSVVDYPYQALIVELLIRHYHMIFDTPLSPLTSSSPTEVCVQLDMRPPYRGKEQLLSRHSKSVGDIQELSSKDFKRHSSTPSYNSSAEYKDSVLLLPADLEGKEFEPADELDSEFFNGIAEVPKASERSLFRSPHVTPATRVHLRPHRNRVSSRPASMPVERSRGRSQEDENPTRSNVDEDDRKGDRGIQSIEEVDETEMSKLRVGPHYRNTMHTNTLRSTWDKQYKHHDVASRTAKNIFNTDSTADDASSSSPSASVSSLNLPVDDSMSTVPSYLNGPYSMPPQHGRILRSGDNVAKYNIVSTAFRSSRTLHPPLETFYNPASGNKAKSLLGLASSTDNEDKEDDDEDDDLEIEVSVDEPLDEDAEQAAASPSHSPNLDDVGINQARPVYPRLRSKQLQEVERREAHFV
ncbi:rho GTPase-activating protein 29 isoform X2 [Corythoichthys intestinalis]|uniref:rho GTPase-activating protein 29 isoform X2 n=1 Tax=Corythoichthys intestinalis TaxID=161448 RepID=UPI0025A5826F|nr:rho GTPase-activating protein 29 isoform X2 [Corythoichthys intestinalis]